MENKQNHSIINTTLNQQQILNYLDEFGKQINTRKSTNFSLEEQLRTITQNYKQAQEKLLCIEKALSSESFIVQKQRVVIKIYKSIINQDMQQQDVLAFLQRLQEDEENTQIYDELGTIKMMLSMKKLKCGKKRTQEEKQLFLFKKQVQKLSNDKLQDNQSIILMKNQSDQLKQKLYSIQTQSNDLKDQIREQKNMINKLNQQIKTYQGTIIKYQQDLMDTHQNIKSSKEKLDIYEQTNKDLRSFYQFVKSKFKFEEKEYAQMNWLTTQLKSKVQNLLKYKKQYKKLKFNVQNHSFLEKQIILLKIYLSDQALHLFKQFQVQKLDCIQNQIRNLSILEKNRIARLQQNEREIWKYKIQLIKNQEYQNGQGVSNQSFISNNHKILTNAPINIYANHTQKTQNHGSKQTSRGQEYSHNRDIEGNINNLVQSFNINNETVQLND